MLKATQVEWEDQISQWEQKKSLFCYRLRRALYILKELKCCSFGKLNVFSSLILPHFLLKIENVGIEQIEEN